MFEKKGDLKSGKKMIEKLKKLQIIDNWVRNWQKSWKKYRNMIKNYEKISKNSLKLT